MEPATSRRRVLASVHVRHGHAVSAERAARSTAGARTSTEAGRGMVNRIRAPTSCVLKLDYYDLCVSVYCAGL